MNPCPGNADFIKKDDGRLIKRCTDCSFPHKPENYEKIIRLLRAKKDVAANHEYHHGGEAVPLLPCGKTDDSFIDFSVNVNPLGIPEKIKEYIKNDIYSLNLCEKYPDQNCSRLRKKLMDWIPENRGNDVSFEILKNLSPENIVFGNGASELISLAVNALSPKDALLVSPTFSGYERALKICDCRLHYVQLSEERDFKLGEEIFDFISRIYPDVIFLCNPNNPTGRMLDKELFEKILQVCEEKGIFLFVDECFIDFTERFDETALQFAGKFSHLIVLNAFTKIFAMAGLRLGYLVSSNPALINKINFLRPEWNVSTVAQYAGEKMLDEPGYVQNTRNIIKNERNFLSKELKALGFKVYLSEVNFILFRADAEKDIPFLRNCGNFRGLDKKFWRTAVRTHEENEKLIAELKKIF